MRKDLLLLWVELLEAKNIFIMRKNNTILLKVVAVYWHSVNMHNLVAVLLSLMLKTNQIQF